MIFLMPTKVLKKRRTAIVFNFFMICFPVQGERVTYEARSCHICGTMLPHLCHDLASSVSRSCLICDTIRSRPWRDGITPLCVRLFSLRVSRKPSFLHSFLLLEELSYRPEAGGTNHTDNGRGKGAFYAKRAYDTNDPRQKKEPPRARAEIIFGFDNDGVEYPYYEKCGQSDGYSG